MKININNNIKLLMTIALLLCLSACTTSDKNESSLAISASETILGNADESVSEVLATEPDKFEPFAYDNSIISLSFYDIYYDKNNGYVSGVIKNISNKSLVLNDEEIRPGEEVAVTPCFNEKEGYNQAYDFYNLNGESVCFLLYDFELDKEKNEPCGLRVYSDTYKDYLTTLELPSLYNYSNDLVSIDIVKISDICENTESTAIGELAAKSIDVTLRITNKCDFDLKYKYDNKIIEKDSSILRELRGSTLQYKEGLPYLAEDFAFHLEEAFDAGEYSIDFMINNKGSKVTELNEKICKLNDSVIANKSAGYEGYTFGSGLAYKDDSYEISVFSVELSPIDGLLSIYVTIINNSDENSFLELSGFSTHLYDGLVEANSYGGGEVYVSMNDISEENGMYKCCFPVVLRNEKGKIVLKKDISGVLDNDLVNEISKYSSDLEIIKLADVHDSNDYIEFNATDISMIDSDGDFCYYKANVSIKNISNSELLISGYYAGTKDTLKPGEKYSWAMNGRYNSYEVGYFDLSACDKSNTELYENNIVYYYQLDTNYSS